MRSIYLSPSLQEWNIGYGDFGTEEEKMNLIADVIENELTPYKVKVFRNKPERSLAYAVFDSNKKNVDLHLAIHSNAYNKESRGCEVFCHRYNSAGHEFANQLYDAISKITPTSDRGVKEGYNFFGKNKHLFELHRTKAPASLVEVGFHDNKDDSKWISDSIELIGVAIAWVIIKFLELEINFNWKHNGVIELNKLGILKDKIGWLKKIDDPMPVWAVTILISEMYKKLAEKLH